jgi:hypothetical protein
MNRMVRMGNGKSCSSCSSCLIFIRATRNPWIIGRLFTAENLAFCKKCRDHEPPGRSAAPKVFGAAGSRGMRGRRSASSPQFQNGNWGLESPQNPQVGKPALQGPGSRKAAQTSCPAPLFLDSPAVGWKFAIRS